jgi:segregation and condensation protein A
VNDKYEVKLDLFEGPLDLLLYLVTKAEVDITQISVAAITDQYLQYLDVMRDLNIDVAAEYLHMAATLIRIKARELLPDENKDEVLPGEEGIYNREQLIAQLLEFKKFKEAAYSLRGFEAHQAGSHGRGTVEEIVPGTATDEVFIGNVTVIDLFEAFRRILERAGREDPSHVVRRSDVRIDDRIERIFSALGETGAEIAFEELFKDDLRKMVIVVTFMALLELIKMQEIQFRQEKQFGGIFVSRRDPSSRDRMDDPADETAENTPLTDVDKGEK